MGRFAANTGHVKTLLGSLLVAAAVVVAGCDSSGNEGPPQPDGNKVNTPGPGNPKEEAPLLLDDEPLLLLDGGGPANLPTPTGPVADNSRCFVCHLNYSEEEFAVTHALSNIGCETCHGHCDEHCGDEDNITPPTIMFPKDQIDPACRKCHDEEKIIDGQLWCIREPKPSDAGKHCTDCHGKHRLARRTSQWDKKTGKLLVGGWQDHK